MFKGIRELNIVQILCTMYTVSQKKTSPTFLAITRESIDIFL